MPPAMKAITRHPTMGRLRGKPLFARLNKRHPVTPNSVLRTIGLPGSVGEVYQLPPASSQHIFMATCAREAYFRVSTHVAGSELSVQVTGGLLLSVCEAETGKCRMPNLA